MVHPSGADTRVSSGPYAVGVSIWTRFGYDYRAGGGELMNLMRPEKQRTRRESNPQPSDP